MEGEVWVRDPVKEMHWVLVSSGLWAGDRGKCPLWDVTPGILCPRRGGAAYSGSPGGGQNIMKRREDLGWLQGECEALPQVSLALERRLPPAE